MADWCTRSRNNFLTILLLVLCVCALSMSALSASAFEQLRLATGNDAISLGLGNNQDDGRSFSALLSTRLAMGLDIAFEITSFTDQRNSAMRHDTMDLSVTYPFSFLLGGPWSLAGRGGPSLTVAGPFGLEWAQNFLHSFKNKQPVLLPTDSRNPTAHIGFDADIALQYTQRTHQGSLSAAVTHRHAWETIGQAAVQYRWADTLSLALGYQHTKGWSGFPSQYMQEERYNGFFIQTHYDGPLLQTNYLFFPHSGFGYGYIGFDLLSFAAEPTYQKSDLTTSHGLYYEMDGTPLRLTSVGKNGFSIDVLYISGPVKPIYRYNISVWQLAYQWKFCNWTTLFCPAIKASAGLKRINLVQNFDEPIFEVTKPLLGLEASIKIGSAPMMVVANTAYWMRIAASLHYLIDAPKDATVSPIAVHTKPWTFILGLILQIDHDLSAV
jgi:hypothetical protein